MFAKFENILRLLREAPCGWRRRLRIAAFRHAPVPSSTQGKEVRPSFLRQKVARRGNPGDQFVGLRSVMYLRSAPRRAGKGTLVPRRVGPAAPELGSPARKGPSQPSMPSSNSRAIAPGRAPFCVLLLKRPLAPDSETTSSPIPETPIPALPPDPTPPDQNVRGRNYGCAHAERPTKGRKGCKGRKPQMSFPCKAAHSTHFHRSYTPRR